MTSGIRAMYVNSDDNIKLGNGAKFFSENRARDANKSRAGVMQQGGQLLVRHAE